jgi:predicted aspartyl protease
MATATIQVAYEAETSSLKATVNEINQINDTVVKGAQESASKVKKSFDGIANSFTAAFSGGEAKKAIDNQAKALDKLTGSGKSLTGQLRGLKAELAQLEIAGQDGTQAFNELLIAAARLEDQIGDTRDRVRILASDTFKFDAAVGATQALASGFELAQGAAALFGSESEDLQKIIAKVTAATAVANGVQQLATLIKEESAIKTVVLTAATTAYNLAVGTSTGALKAFRLALAATGVGLLVVGLIALIENFDKIKDALSGTSDATRAFEAAQKSANAELAKTKGFLTEAALAQQELNDKLAVSQGKLSKEQAEANKRNRDGIANIVKDTKGLIVERIKLDEVIAAQQKTVDDLQKKQAGFAKNEQQTVRQSTALKLAAAQEELNASNSTRARVVADIAAKTKANVDAAKTEVDIINSDAKKEADEKRLEAIKAANAKALEEQKKAAEDQANARAQLLKLEEEALIASLDEQSKILNDNNNKVIELEKTFAAARFKEGSAEAIAAQQQLATAIAEIRTQDLAQLAALDKAANEKLLKDKLDVAKAAEGATLQQQLAALEEQQTIELSFAETLGLSELEISTRYATQIGKVKTDIAAATIETQINELKTLEIEEGSSLQRREQLIRLDAQKRIDAAKGDASAIKLINAETDQAITAARSEETQKQIALLEQYAEEVSNILGSLNEISQAQSQQRIADIEEASAKELEAINASSDLERDKIRSRDALAKRTAQRIAEEKTKQARQDKALALFEIGINTAKGVISALALTPPNPILAAFIAASGLAEAAVVASKPIPKFEKGGLIGGKLHSQGGTMIEAEQGEYMVNRRQTAKHRRELDAMNHSTEAFRKMIDEKYVRPALMSYSAGRRGKEGVTVNASLNSKSMEKEMRGMRKDLKNRNVIVNINQQDSRYSWQ